MTTFGEQLTVWTVRLSMVLFAGAFLFSSGSQDRRFLRWLWTLAYGWLVVHVICAFHFYHGWSHQAALVDTGRRTGEQIGWAFAGGLYFNYVFVALWGMDILCWWLSPSAYSTRSKWASRAIHGFLLFITFQATVVFAQGPTRWVAAVLFVLAGVKSISKSCGAPK